MCDVLWRVVMSCMSWACVQRAAGHESSGLEKDGLTFHRRVILFYHRLCHNLGPMAAGNRAVRALSHKRACMCSTVVTGLTTHAQCLPEAAPGGAALTIGNW